ncbi:MAG: zinc-dependent alcohol dehydrogenase family protein [Thermodesulfobacteriota bacterium]
MKVMAITQVSSLREDNRPLTELDLPVPEPGEKEILLSVSACGVCHTEIDEIEGRTPPAFFPMVPGHEIVGRVVKTGPKAERFSIGDRVGVAWIARACGKCPACLRGEENLCPDFAGTGRDVFGGYAEFAKVAEDFAYPIPDVFTDSQAAPLLCAGAIGFRSLRLAGDLSGARLGLTGFGASAHLVLKMVQGSLPHASVYVFARSAKEREFALSLGACWAGETEEPAPEKLSAIIDTTPAWKPVLFALRNLAPGGRLVINAIRKQGDDRLALSELDYPRDLWMEKEIKSVANVTRMDVSGFLDLAARIPILPTVTEYTLSRANEAVCDLYSGHVRGAKVLIP